MHEFEILTCSASEGSKFIPATYSTSPLLATNWDVAVDWMWRQKCVNSAKIGWKSSMSTKNRIIKLENINFVCFLLSLIVKVYLLMCFIRIFIVNPKVFLCLTVFLRRSTLDCVRHYFEKDKKQKWK